MMEHIIVLSHHSIVRGVQILTWFIKFVEEPERPSTVKTIVFSTRSYPARIFRGILGIHDLDGERCC